MSWIIITLIAPFIWSLMNHLDKFIITRYSKEIGIGAISSLSAVFAGITLPFIYLINPNILNVSFGDISVLIITGILTAAGILFYLFALQRDDASHIVPFWFLIPVFSYFLGVFFLGEFLSLDKIIGAVIVIVGAMILSLEFDNKFRVKHITVLLMVASSLVLSVNNVLFKFITIEYSFWASVFWNHTGVLIFGLLLLVIIRKYRNDFKQILVSRDHKLAYLNVINETLQIVAGLVSYYSITLAPVSIVLLISYSFQPLFVIIEGVIITAFMPGIIREHITKKHLIHKLSAISLMIIGVIQIVL